MSQVGIDGVISMQAAGLNARAHANAIGGLICSRRERQKLTTSTRVGD
jgi:hypothetical protein